MNDPIIITFTDLKKAFFRHALALKVFAGFSFICAFVFLLTKEPQFLAEVTFQRYSRLNYPAENSALMLDSNQVLKPVIEDLGLQMIIQKNFWHKWLDNAKENIFYACNRSFKESQNFNFSCVNYEGQKEMPVLLQITSANTYQILSNEKKILADGQIAELVSTPFFSMRVDQFSEKYKMNIPYYFILTPWKKAVDQVRSKLEIRPGKLEKNSLKIYFSDHDESLPIKVITHIIQFYEKYIFLENDRTLGQTKEYFKKREADVFKRLDTAFTDYTINLASTSLKKEWLQEQMLILKKELGIRLLQNIENMMEAQERSLHSYNTAKPFEPSATSLHPPTHNLIGYSLLSSCIGLLVGYFYFVSRMIIQGFPVSHEGLIASGIHSCGILSSCCGYPLAQLSSPDLKTLRQICAFIGSHKNPDRSLIIALITEQYPDYTCSLANLLALRGFKILMVDCSFDQIIADNLPTFIQYLEGSIAQIPIRHLKEYDKLLMGQTEYGFEWLAHPKFSSSLLQCKQYDLILLTTTIAAKEVEGQIFCKIADCVVVTTQADSKQDLLPYTRTPSATFVIIEESS